MKSFLTLLILFIFTYNIFAQDTLSIQLYKRYYWGSTTTNIKKEKFVIYKIENNNGSISTIHYSLLKNRIETSTTFKGKEPYGIWISTGTKYSNGKSKEYIDKTNYEFELVYCNEVDKDVYNKDKIKGLEVNDVFEKAKPIGGNEVIFKIISQVNYPMFAIDNDIEGKILGHIKKYGEKIIFVKKMAYGIINIRIIFTQINT